MAGQKSSRKALKTKKAVKFGTVLAELLRKGAQRYYGA